jgi:hypothetical protein
VQTNNASIWLVLWGKNTVFCPFPKGSKAGLQHKDLGEDTVIDANGGRFQALRTHYQWKNGLAVKDWRYVVRIANINTSNLVAKPAANLIKLMLRAIFRIPNLRGPSGVLHEPQRRPDAPGPRPEHQLQRGEGPGGDQPVRRAHRQHELHGHPDPAL